MKNTVLYFLFQILGLFTCAQPLFISDSLERYIRREMEFYQIPGMAVGIVKDGKIVYQKGFGYRDLSRTEMVDENTQFYIASNTKLFTGMALSMLEQKGILSLNDPVQKYFPDFNLHNKELGRLVTLRDMLSHRIGVTTFQGDFSFFNTLYSRSEIMQKMSLLPATLLFRQQFGYCNSCYLTAGQVIQQRTGQPWEVFVYDSLIIPSGMKNTAALSMGYSRMSNAARPHTIEASGRLVEVTPDRWDNLAPAASIISNVADMNRWLLFQLAEGKKGDKQLIPASVFARTRQINTVLGTRTGKGNGPILTGYGLGIFIDVLNNGSFQYRHTGGASGMVSSVAFLPAQQLGLVILTNQDAQPFFEVLRQRIVNAYLGENMNLDTSSHKSFTEEIKGNQDRLLAFRAKVKSVAATRNMAPEIAGNYRNDLYGYMSIVRNGQAWKATFKNHPDLTAQLEYMGENEFLSIYNNPVMGIHPMRFKVADNKATEAIVKVNDFIEYGSYLFIKAD